MKYDNVVVGGGLAGLTIAAELLKKTSGSVCIIERSEFGGFCRSYPSEGVTFDVGGHAFQNIAALPEFYRNLVEWGQYRKRGVSFGVSGVRYDKPIQDCFPPESSGSPDLADTFEQYYTKKFGPKLYSEFFNAYNSRLLQQPLRETYPSSIQNVRSPSQGAKYYNDDFFYPKSGGIQSFIDALVKTSDITSRCTVLKDTVVNVSGDIKPRVFTSLNGPVNAGRVFVTAPIRDLGEFKFKLPAPTVEVVNCFATPTEPLPEQWSWVYLADREVMPFRFGSYNAFGMTGRDAMGRIPVYIESPASSFRPQVAGGFKYLSVGAITSVIDVPHAYPVYGYPSEEAIKDAYIEECAKRGIFWAGRYGTDRWFSMIETMKNAIETVEKSLHFN